MRASTLFGLTVAILLGLGAVIAAKTFGLFERAPIAEVRTEPVQVLVATTNLYEGIAIRPEYVAVRSLRMEDLEEYRRDPSAFLPATPNAAELRVPNRNIPAGTIMRREFLHDLELPRGPLGDIRPGMRAVNVSLPRERAAGGLLRVGDRVDVMLTTNIRGSGSGSQTVARSAFIARNLRVIGKHNVIFNVLMPNTGTAPIPHTLEANPYRAALIEFAQAKGQVNLVPSPPVQVVGLGRGSSSDLALLDSPEYRADPDRVEKLLNGELNVSEADLERIFQLAPPPPPPNASKPPVVVPHMNGIRFSAGAVLTPDKTGFYKPQDSLRIEDPKNGGGPAPSFQGQPAMGYVFTTPPQPGDRRR